MAYKTEKQIGGIHTNNLGKKQLQYLEDLKSCPTDKEYCLIQKKDITCYKSSTVDKHMISLGWKHGSLKSVGMALSQKDIFKRTMDGWGSGFVIDEIQLAKYKTEGKT